jgi:putative transport protein
MHPTFGRIPGAAQWLLSDLGLNLFIACVGLSSGSQALAALQNSGLSIFLAGAVTVLASIVVGLFFGKYVLRMNPVLLLGALTGAKVLPPALTALQEETDSPMLSLSFAAPFAFANVLLTVLGSLIINLM